MTPIDEPQITICLLHESLGCFQFARHTRPTRVPAALFDHMAPPET